MPRLPFGRGSDERYLILKTKGFNELRDIIVDRVSDVVGVSDKSASLKAA